MRSKALTEGGPSTCPAPSPAIPWPKSRQLSSSSGSHAEPSRSDCTSYGFAEMASGSRAGRNSSPEARLLGSAVGQALGRASRAEPEPGYTFVFGQPVTVVRPGPVGSAPGVQVPVRCHAGDFLKQIDQNA